MNDKKTFNQTTYSSYEEGDKAVAVMAMGGVYGGGSKTLVTDKTQEPTVYCLHKGPTPTSNIYKDKAGALISTDYKQPPTVISFDPGACRYLGCAFEDKTKALTNGTAPGFHDGVAIKKNANYSVRRLTPLECCRLQGFPDDWCDGVEGSDSAQYKMWGNGVGLPCVLYIMEGIKEAGDKYNL